MHTPLEGTVISTQRTVLESLASVNAKQEEALNTGNVELLTELSNLRTRTVQDAAAFLPPQVDWDPSLLGLATQVRDESENLQHNIRACIARVRRDLVNLTERERMTNYVSGRMARQKATWQA